MLRRYLILIVPLFLIFSLAFADNFGLRIFRKNDASTKNILKTIHNKQISQMAWKWVREHASDDPKIQVIDISSKIQSVAISCFEVHYGAAHGGVVFNGLTYEIKTGKIYKLQDIFITSSDWKNILWPHVKIKLSYMAETEKQIPQFRNFSLDGQNLHLYYDRCSPFPCICGHRDIIIPINQIKHILKPLFLKQ